MATGMELATAYVSILPSTSGLGKGLGKEFGQVEKDAEATGKKSGSRFTAAFGKWAKRGLLVAGAAVGAAAGAAVVSGFRSAIDQQQGQAVLAGLYGDAEKAADTLEGLKRMASGSPIDYSAYQNAAGSLAYAGVEGEQTIGVLENVGKAITAAGGDSSNMDRATDAILKGVNAGKFQLDTLQQLSDAGVPILSGLAEHLGVPMETVNKMASAGEIALEDVIAVMENATGDTFGQMISAGESATETFGNQWKMAKDNIQVALGETMLPLIEQITPLIKPMGDAMVEAVEAIPEMVEGIKDGLQWVKDNLPWLSTLAGTLTAAGIAGWVASGGLTAAGVAIKGVFTAISAGIRAIPVIGWIILGIGLLITALVWFFTETEAGQAIWETVWGAIKTAAAAVWEWIRDTLWPGLVAAWEAISDGAVWLYENGIKPAWDGIMTAVDAVAGWIMNTAVPWLQSAWDAISGAAQWLWDQMVAVWNGIMTAVRNVVSWFQTWVWPVIEMVIALIKLGFETMRDALKAAWDFVKNRVINPVVQWFKNTAWPLIKTIIDNIKTGFNIMRDALKAAWQFIKDRVINPVVTWLRDTVWAGIISPTLDKIKTGFNVMRDALRDAWNFIKDRVINPVVTWFRDTVQPIFDRVTDGISDAFGNLKDSIGDAWDAIKDAAKQPIRFVVDTVVNDALIGNFNKVAKKLGTSTLPSVSLPSGFARGGVLPGWSRMSDGDDQLVPMRRGEGVLVSEGLRSARDKAAFLAANAAGRRGVGFSDFMQGGFAGGGIFDGIRGLGSKAKDLAGHALDKVVEGIDFVAEAISDPKAMFTKVYDSVVGQFPAFGVATDMAKGAGKKLLDGVVDSVLGAFGPGSDADVGPMPAGASRSLSYARQVASAYGLTMTSFRRAGARTAGSGSLSLHAQGRAMDFSNSSGPTPQMMRFFNAMHPLKPTELLYSPAGGRQWRRSGRMANTTGATRRGHFNHVHVGFNKGGIFDQGGMLQPGMTGINLTRKPEAVLDPRTTAAYTAHAESVARNDGEMTLSARSIEDLADALSMRPNVVQIGTRQAGQLALAGAGANRAMGGRL